MKRCTECNGIMKEQKSRTPEGVEYNFFKCTMCGEEIVNMEQLHNVAESLKK